MAEEWAICPYALTLKSIPCVRAPNWKPPKRPPREEQVNQGEYTRKSTNRRMGESVGIYHKAVRTTDSLPQLGPSSQSREHTQFDPTYVKFKSRQS